VPQEPRHTRHTECVTRAEELNNIVASERLAPSSAQGAPLRRTDQAEALQVSDKVGRFVDEGRADRIR